MLKKFLAILEAIKDVDSEEVLRFADWLEGLDENTTGLDDKGARVARKLASVLKLIGR